MTKTEELYFALKSCSDGDCNECPRYKNLHSRNTYFCKKELLSNAREYIGELLKIDEVISIMDEAETQKRIHDNKL